MFNLSFEWINSWLQEDTSDFWLHRSGEEAVLHNEDENPEGINFVSAISTR